MRMTKYLHTHRQKKINLVLSQVGNICNIYMTEIIGYQNDMVLSIDTDVFERNSRGRIGKAYG